MPLNLRHKRHYKKKIASYIFLICIIVVVIYLFNMFISSGRSAFVSPIGKAGVDQPMVKKILKEKGVPFESVVFSDYFLVTLQNNEQVRLSPDKDLYRQVASLQKILRELTIEGKTFKSIDFRFSEPIISF
jgi:hypothetical protein